MEKLEQITTGIDEKSPKFVEVSERKYEGLSLIKEEAYQGYTSIRYWM